MAVASWEAYRRHSRPGADPQETETLSRDVDTLFGQGYPARLREPSPIPGEFPELREELDATEETVRSLFREFTPDELPSIYGAYERLLSEIVFQSPEPPPGFTCNMEENFVAIRRELALIFLRCISPGPYPLTNVYDVDHVRWPVNTLRPFKVRALITKFGLADGVIKTDAHTAHVLAASERERVYEGKVTRAKREGLLTLHHDADIFFQFFQPEEAI